MIMNPPEGSSGKAKVTVQLHDLEMKDATTITNISPICPTGKLDVLSLRQDAVLDLVENAPPISSEMLVKLFEAAASSEHFALAPAVKFNHEHTVVLTGVVIYVEKELDLDKCGTWPMA